MCSIRKQAEPLFTESACHLCQRKGEFDYLVCDACLTQLSAEIQPDRMLDNAVFLAAGVPDWWQSRGRLSCELIPPIGQYVIAGVLPLLRQRQDIVVKNGNIARAPDRRARSKPADLFSRFDSLKSRGTQTLALDQAAKSFTEDELAQLLEHYPVVFLFSSRPSFIIV